MASVRFGSVCCTDQSGGEGEYLEAWHVGWGSVQAMFTLSAVSVAVPMSISVFVSVGLLCVVRGEY